MHQSEMRELDALVAMAESFDPKALLERLSAAFAKTAAARGDDALKRAAEATQGAAKRLGDEDPPEDEDEEADAEDSDDGDDASDDEATADGDEEDEDEEPEAEDEEEAEAAASHRKRAPKMLMKKTHWRAKMVMADGAKRTLFFDEESSTPDVGASEWGIRSFRGTATLKERWRVERPTDFIVYYFGTDAEGHRRPMGKGAPVHVQPFKPLNADTPSAAAAPREAAFEGGDDPTLRALKFMETQRANNRAELRSEQEQRAKMDLELRRIASQERIELAKIQPPAPAAESSPALEQFTSVLQGLSQQLQQQKEEIQKIRDTAAGAKQDSIDKIIEAVRPFLTGLAARQEPAPTRTVVQLVRGGRDGSGEQG